MAFFLKWTYEGGEERCGATIISESWLMTAAHCTNDFATGIVLLGLTNVAVTYQRETYRVVESVIHPKYNPVTLENDIALLKVATKIHFNEHVQPICLTKNDLSMTQAGQFALVSGWGVHSVPDDTFDFMKDSPEMREQSAEWNERNSLGDGQNDDEKVAYKPHVVLKRLSDNLLNAKIPIIDTAECREKWFNEVKSDGLTQICAGDLQKGTSKGDSGGPLQVRGEDGRWYQIGITSFGDESSDEAILDQKTNPGKNQNI
uniref:Peptidase S1 domain-containing protein n=1 Tax=Plectus sambesii TaxID=2011161 RepID=A0A914VIZ5_9BILA